VLVLDRALTNVEKSANAYRDPSYSGVHLVSYYCGVDLGGTKILAAIASDGRILAEADTPTHGRAADAGQAVIETVTGLCARAGIAVRDLSATVVAGAGAPQPDGALHLAPNLGPSAELNLMQQLQAALGNVVVENDVNAAAVAEGTTLDAENFVFIAVGTGIGMGIVCGSEVIRGAHGAAGEIGYLPFGADPLNPDHHRHGPLEEIVSGRGIETMFRDLSGKPSTAREIFQRATELGSGPEEDLIDRVSYQAARAVVAVCAILDPEVVVLGGGIGSRDDFRARVQRWLIALGHGETDLRLSAFRERATLEGALELARRLVTAYRHERTLSR
jgi:glucokinase